MKKIATTLFATCLMLSGAVHAQDAMKKDAMGKDSMHKDAMGKDAMGKSAMKKPAMKMDKMAMAEKKKDAMAMEGNKKMRWGRMQ